MSAFLLILAIISVLAILIIIVSLLIKHFSESVIQKLKSVKPKIIIYKADKKDKKL